MYNQRLTDAAHLPDSSHFFLWSSSCRTYASTSVLVHSCEADVLHCCSVSPVGLVVLPSCKLVLLFLLFLRTHNEAGSCNVDKKLQHTCRCLGCSHWLEGSAAMLRHWGSACAI